MLAVDVDAVFSDLIVWQDLDGDGVSDDGEMMSLTDAGITSIDLGYTNISETNAGHDVLQRSTVTFADGSTTTIDDVYFESDTRSSVALLPDGFEYHEDVFRLPALFGYGQIASTWVALSQDADLRQDAVDLVSLSATGDIRGFLEDFEAFVLAWAGVDGVAPTSRGAYIDARHLEFLERAYGSSYDQFQGQGSSVQSDPLDVAAAALEEQYNTLMQRLAGRFLAQSATSDALLTATTEAEFNTAMDAHIFGGMTSLLAAYSPGDRLLDGDLQPMFDDLVDALDSGLITMSDAAVALFLVQPDIESDLGAFRTLVRALPHGSNSLNASILAHTLDAFVEGQDLIGPNAFDDLDARIASFIVLDTGGGTVTGVAEADLYFHETGGDSYTIRELLFASLQSTGPYHSSEVTSGQREACCSSATSRIQDN